MHRTEGGWVSTESVLKIMNHLNDIPNVPLLQHLGCSKLSHRLGPDHFHPDQEQEGGKKNLLQLRVRQ